MSLTAEQKVQLGNILSTLDTLGFHEAFNLWKLYRDQNLQRIALQFHVGSRVMFKSRQGLPVKGTVIKATRGSKTLHVKADDGRPWRVGASLLTKI